MAPLRVSITKSEWLPDDPTASVPSRPWKSPFITTWDDSRNQNHPTDSAEEASFCALQLRQRNCLALQPLQQRLILGAVKGAHTKKLNCSFLANSANASAI